MSRVVLLLVALALLAPVADARAADAAPAAAEPSALRAWRFAMLQFTATANGHLRVYDVSDPDHPRLIDDRDMGGEVIDVHFDGGVLVAVVVAPQAVLLTIDDRGRLVDYKAPAGLPRAVTATSVSALPTGESPRSLFEIGRVVAVVSGEAEIELFRAGSVKAGRAVRVRGRGLESRTDPFTGESYEAPAGDGQVRPLVLRVAGARAVVELARGDAIEVGDPVELTGEPAVRHHWQPPRGDYESWFSFGVRPVLPISSVGLGLELGAGLRSGAIDFEFRASPITLATDHGLITTTLQANVLYAGNAGAIGMGGGLAYLRDFSSCDVFSGFTFEPQSSCMVWMPAVAIVARAGSLDGLHLSANLAGFFNEGDLRGAQFDGALVVPLSREADFRMAWVAHGDYALFELGGRLYLRGNGGRDTTIFTFGIGGMEAELSGRDLEGPHVTLGWEFRR